MSLLLEETMRICKRTDSIDKRGKGARQSLLLDPQGRGGEELRPWVYAREDTVITAPSRWVSVVLFCDASFGRSPTVMVT